MDGAGTAYRYKAETLPDTARLASLIAERADAGTVIALDGDLGAGKTAFAQAFARALGVRQVVNSPTFTLIKEYEGRALPLYHMDVYRLSLVEAGELGLEDYFYGKGVVLVEWASRITELLPPERFTIYLEQGTAGERIFHLRPAGQPYANWCKILQQNGVLTYDETDATT